jgi:hypothetical protein
VTASRRVASFGLVLLVAFVTLSGLMRVAAAHDVRPAYLQIDPLGADRYTLIWRTPLLSGAPLPVVLDLPAEAETLSQPAIQTLPGSLIERRVIAVQGGLS